METNLPGAVAGTDAGDVTPRGPVAGADESAGKEKEPEVVRPKGRRGKKPLKLFWIIITQESDDPIEGAFNGKFFAIPSNKRILVTEGVVTALTLAEKTRMKRKKSYENLEDLGNMESASQFEEIVTPAYPTLQAQEATQAEVVEALEGGKIKIHSARDAR